MTKKLDGKIAVITGGTTGIGLATAQLFASEGAHVIVTGRNPETLAQARTTLGDHAEVIASDAGDPEAVQSLFDGIKAKHGRVDVLFLNAGIAKFGGLEEFPLEAAQQLLQVNFIGPWLALKHASALFQQGSSVILNTSAVHQLGVPGSSVYAATKAALRSLARTATVELAPKGVRVNAISPGPIETPIYGKLGMSAAEVEGFSGSILPQVPAGKFGKAEDIAHAALYLASSDSAYVYGAELSVDGGFAQT